MLALFKCREFYLRVHLLHITDAVLMLQSFDLDMNTGTLTFTFSEPANANTLDPTQVTLQDSPTALNTTVTVTLSNTTTTLSGNGPVITLQLSQGDTDRIKASTELATSVDNTFLSLTANAIQDVGGSPVVPVSPSSALPVNTFTEDFTQPELASFSLDLNVGSLQFTFSEAVNISTLNATGITLQSHPSSPIIVFTLTGGSVVSVSFTEMMLRLTTNDANVLRQMQGLATSVADTYLAVTSNIIQDYNGNSLVPILPSAALRATQFTADTPPEAVSFPVFDLNTGMLSISFSEPVSASSVIITQFTLYSDRSSTATASYTLTGGVIASPDGSVLVIYLSREDLNQIKRHQNLCTNATNCIPAFTSQLVSDLSGNLVNAIQDVGGSPVVPVSPSSALPVNTFTEDFTQPELASFSLDLNVGSLQFTFSEAVNISTLNATGITLQSHPSSPIIVFTLTGGSVVSVSFTEMMLRLTTNDANVLRQMQGLATSVADTYLAVTSNIIQDYNGNSLVPILPSAALRATQFTADTPPEAVSFPVFDLNTEMLSISFSEPVNASSVNINSSHSTAITLPLLLHPTL